MSSGGGRTLMGDAALRSAARLPAGLEPEARLSKQQQRQAMRAPQSVASGPGRRRAAAAPVTSVRRYSGLSAEERAQLRRDALLAAALELFAEHGYASTSIDQICQSASVGLKGFYDEFATKERLLLALYVELNERVVVSFVAEIAGLQSSDDSMQFLLCTWVHALLRDERAARVLFIESTGVSMSVEAFRQRNHHRMAKQIARGYDLGLFGPPALPHLPLSIALALTGGLLELLRAWLLHPGSTSVDELTDQVVQFCRLVFDGLVADAG